jgi:DNA modification methylase
MTAKVLVGDCREVLLTLEPNSIDACVCDPPYGLEFMGKEWDKLGAKIESTAGATDSFAMQRKGSLPFGGGGQRVVYGSNVKSMQAWHETWAREVYRVLKPGAHLLAFSGTRTSHRMVCAIEDAGFEIRDCLMYLYGSGFPKSKNLDGDWDGWGTALKPAYEPIILARKRIVGDCPLFTTLAAD